MKASAYFSIMGVTFLSLILVSGCATTVDLNKFHDADMKEAEIMPSKALLKQERRKIVVFDADEGNLRNAVDAQLGKTFAVAVEAELVEAGAEIVDRELAIKLKDELRLAESHGAGNYKGPQVAQYTVRGKLNSAEYGAKYYEVNRWKDSEGKYHVDPAYYEHKGVVAGIASIYELPSLRLLATVKVDGSASITDPKMSANQQTGASLLRSATVNAIRRSGYELKNLFSPQGYVVERRSDGDKSIFKILMGASQGVRSEDKVIIYSLRKKMNALTGEEKTDEFPVAHAIVSDQINNTESWVVPENNDASLLVRLGDFVKVRYEGKHFY